MPSIFHTARSRWLVFLAACLIPLAIAVGFIFSLPKYYEIRSIVELATTNDQGRPKIIDAPDQVAKAAIDMYLPFALYGVEHQKVVDAPIPRSLRVDVSGGAVSLSDRVRAGEESRHVGLQQRILDQIIAQQKSLTKTARELLEISIKSAQRTIKNLDAQIHVSEDRLQDLEKRSAAQDQTINDLQRSLATQPADQGSHRDDIQYARERLWSEEDISRKIEAVRTHIGRELIDSSRQKEEQIKFEALNELQLSAIKDAQIIVPPTIAPLATARIPLFLIAALVGSLVFAVLVILLFDKFRFRALE